MIHFTLSPESAEVVMTIIQRTKKITTTPPQFAIFGEVCSKVKLFIKTKKNLSDMRYLTWHTPGAPNDCFL